MSSLFDRFEDQLREAAHAQVAQRGRRAGLRRVTGWLRAGGRSAPVVIAVATTVAVVVVARVHARHGDGGGSPAPGGQLPALGSAQARRDFKDIRAATLATQRSAVCRARGAQPPAVINGRPGAALISTLAVLRRPATSSDRLPAHAIDGTGGVYAGAARRARSTAGTTYYLVPVRVFPDAGQPTVRCLEAQSAAVKRALPSIPASDRGSVWAFERRLVAYDRRLLSAPPSDGLCFVSHSSHSGSQSCGITPAQIRNGISGADDEGDTYSGIVPDGVATVAVRFAAGGGRLSAPGESARSVTGKVVGNVWAVHVPGPSAAAPIVIWRSADGRVVHRITPPTRAQAMAACRKNPIACLSVSAGTSSASGSGRSESSSSSASATTPAG